MLKRYTPLYIALLVIGIVMVLLFLRPESALGLTVDVNAVKKFDGFTAGFKLDDGTGQPETVVIEAEINLPEGEFQDIVKATLDIETADGGSGFLNVSAVELPLPASTGDPVVDRELTDQITQGQLFVDAKLVRLVPDAFGYGYGYRAIGGKGFIKFTIRYIPPSIAGTYKATIKAISEQGSEISSNTTEFIILAPFPSGSVTALSTVYPVSNVEALSRDLVVVRALVSGDVVQHVVSATVNPGLLNANTGSMDAVSKFHPAILIKWGIDTGDANEANFLFPMRIVPQAEALTCNACPASIKVTDIAGQVVELTGDNAAKVKVVATRSSFNIYLMPGLNFISTPLQCPSTTNTADCPANSDPNAFEFKLAKLLQQTFVNAKSGSGSGDVVEIIWYYCAKEGSGDSPIDADCQSAGVTGDFISLRANSKQQPNRNARSGTGLHH